MANTPNQSSRAESDLSIGVTANAGKTRIEQLCEAVRGLSPEIKSAWYDFKTGGHHVTVNRAGGTGRRIDDS